MWRSVTKALRREVLAEELFRVGASLETQSAVLEGFDSDEIDFTYSANGHVEVFLTDRGRQINGDVEAIRTAL